MSFKIKSTSENINAIGGISLINSFLSKIKFNSVINSIQTTSRKGVYSNADILRTYIGLLVQGRFNFDDLALYQNDPFFCKALGLESCCSQARLRQRLELFPVATHSILRNLNVQLLQGRKLSSVSTSVGELIPCDCDVSPMDNSRSKKEDVSFTYKGFDGYAPMFAYLGAEGFMLDCELRPGKQHCQNGTVNFLERVYENLDKLGVTENTLLRLDSGNDSVENLELINNRGYYIIKRNLRKESKEMWLKTAMDCGVRKEIRAGKTVYTGNYYSDLYNAPITFKVTVRETDVNGQYFLTPELEVETYWTNLPDDAERIIGLYHDHGTSEQFHSELKSDMNIEKLPSGKFKTNALILHLSMLAFNMLRSIGQNVVAKKELAPIKIKVKRLRLKTVIRDIIMLPCKYVQHAKQHFIKIGKNCKWFNIFKELYSSHVTR